MAVGEGLGFSEEAVVVCYVLALKGTAGVVEGSELDGYLGDIRIVSSCLRVLPMFLHDEISGCYSHMHRYQSMVSVYPCRRQLLPHSSRSSTQHLLRQSIGSLFAGGP